MSRASSLTLVGDILPVRAPYRPKARCLVGNFEAVLSKGKPVSSKAYTSAVNPGELDKALLGKCLALSVANNHTGDAGPEAFRATVRAIRAAGAIPYGYRDNPAALLKVGGRRVAIIGCLEPCRSRGPELVAEEEVPELIRRFRPKADFLFVTPHWGKESEFTPFAAPKTFRLAQSWIEAGADGVFGHHPHALQRRAEYRGKPVYLSLGNFAFSHPQCDLYPVTRLGLGVEVFPGPGKLEWEERYYYDRRPLREAGPAQSYLRDLSNLRYSTLSWMRLAGPTYLGKSLASWKMRLRGKRGPVEAVKFLVWLILPQTLLMGLASRFKMKPVISGLDRQFQKIGT